MKISTRGRYALRVLIDLAEHHNEGHIPLKLLAERQDLSLKYLEQILPLLIKDQLITSLHGKGGGYRLALPPQEISVGKILRLTEGDLTPVSCLDCNAPVCDRAQNCRTLPMWKEFYKLVSDYFDNKTLADLMK